MAAPIPTLSAWMLMVMAGLMAFFAIRRASAVAKAHTSSQV
jgi:preprotein translocase subunit YajC